VANNRETNYAAQKNRCPRCGHRLDMKSALGNSCTVEMGEMTNGKPTITRCHCGKHRRP
jgi:hypothetical protein